MKKLYLKSVGIWFIFAVLTIAMAILREAFLIGVLNLSANISRVVELPFCYAYIFGITYFLVKNNRDILTTGKLWLIGLMWLILTIAFEFTFGHFVMGNSIEHLLADYNIFKGRTWTFFLLGLLTAPIIMGKVVRVGGGNG